METLYSVLRNLFPYKGYKFSVLECSNHILIGLKNLRKCGNCPSCGKRCRTVETEYERVVRDLDLASRKCFLRFLQKKIRCKCGYRGLERLDFIAKFRRVTQRMETYVVSLAECMSLKEVAQIVELDWKTVKEIDREYIRSLLPMIETLMIRRIAIDEIAIMKGHKYITIIRDYDTGVALKIFFSRTYEATAQALSSLGKEILGKIEYASLDMWDPYIKALREYCPHVKLVFDKFHIAKKINEAVDRVRKREFALVEPEERKLMKKKRWIILNRNKNLKSEQREELKTLMETNEKLYKAYILKEQILSIFDEKETTFEIIKQRLTTWMENILSNEMEEFYDALNTIQAHFEGILNYFRYGMTNAIAEGFNTKINVLKRRAYGFRDVDYFILKIYQQSLQRFA